MSEQNNLPAVVPSEVTIQTTTSAFSQLLSLLTQTDEEMLAISNLTAEEVNDHLKHNVDDLKLVHDSLKARALFFEQYEQAFREKRQALENNAERLKQKITETMEAKEFERAPGVLWRLQLNESESVEVKTAATALLRSKFPELIDVKYVWKLKDVKEAIEAGHVPSDVAAIKKKKYAQFYVNKGTAISKGKTK